MLWLFWSSLTDNISGIQISDCQQLIGLEVFMVWMQNSVVIWSSNAKFSDSCLLSSFQRDVVFGACCEVV